MGIWLVKMPCSKVNQQKPSCMVRFQWTKPRTLQAGSTVPDLNTCSSFFYLREVSGLQIVFDVDVPLNFVRYVPHQVIALRRAIERERGRESERGPDQALIERKLYSPR